VPPATRSEFSRLLSARLRRTLWQGSALGPRAGRTPSDVDDLVQDVFVVAYRRLAYFDGKNIVGWLYRIASRSVRDSRRVVWFKYFAPPEPYRSGGSTHGSVDAP
jgi:DNA-directed RNA polymerase specialized sigma24 family protein